MKTINLPTEIRKGRKKLYVLLENETIFIVVDCEVTGGMMKIPMTPAQFEQWQNESNGLKCIQDILPDMLPELREVLITGMTPAEWQKVFGKKQFAKKTLISKFFYHFEE